MPRIPSFAGKAAPQNKSVEMLRQVSDRIADRVLAFASCQRQSFSMTSALDEEVRGVPCNTWSVAKPRHEIKYEPWGVSKGLCRRQL